MRRQSTHVSPSAVSRSRAASTIGSAKSLYSTWPEEPTARAAIMLSVPGPPASSSTLSPGCRASAWTIQSAAGPNWRSILSVSCAQSGATVDQAFSEAER